MTRFTTDEYNKAVLDLLDAKGQLEPDGRVCVICHDSGHQAWECGSNPLLAMVLCAVAAKRANELHDQIHALEERLATENVADELADWNEQVHAFLHWLCGACSYMGESTGPAKIRAPRDV